MLEPIGFQIQQIDPKITQYIKPYKNIHVILQICPLKRINKIWCVQY